MCLQNDVRPAQETKHYAVNQVTLRLATDASSGKLSAWVAEYSLQVEAAAGRALGLLGTVVPLPTRARRGG